MKTSEIERLAYWLWRERGMPLGSPETDWLLAEALLKRRHLLLACQLRELPSFSISMCKRTR